MSGDVKNPQATLRGEIMADAHRQAERLLRRAKQDAEKISKKAAEEAARQREQALENASKTAARHAALKLARIPVERARMRATYIEKILLDVRDAAALKLAPQTQRLSREALMALIAEAVGKMEGDTFQMQLHPDDQSTLAEQPFLDELRQRVNKPGLEIRLGEPLAGDDSGPRLSDTEGRQLWDNRLVSRLVRLWPDLRRQVAAVTGLDAVDPHVEVQS